MPQQADEQRKGDAVPATKMQAGILDPPPEHLLAAALTFMPTAASDCQGALRSLRELIRRELAADINEIDPESNPAAPSADTGELGVDTGYDTTNLIVTLGVSSSGFQRLGVSQDQLPQDLIPIDWDSFGDKPTNPNEGDLVLLISAESSYIVEHVLRRIGHELGNQLSIVWTLAGEQRNGGRSHGGPLTADSARALIGFHDGLSNLDPTDLADQALIFVGQDGAPPCPAPPPAGPQPPPQPGEPGYGQQGTPGPIFPPGLRQPPPTEPPWTKDGSYVMVRASGLNTGQWDQNTLQQQEQVVGRWKYSGATLDNPNEAAHRHDPPIFAADPANNQVPLTSHIRRANPRALPTDVLRRIFRRGYPLILPSVQGPLDLGLLFVAFGRSLSCQVEFIMRAWLKNKDFPVPGSGVDPLLALETQVLAGGYYFVPPVADPNEPWNWVVPGT
ncbi:MAG: Dyp-type peroxidase [Minisyncoccia bacterium]